MLSILLLHTLKVHRVGRFNVKTMKACPYVCSSIIFYHPMIIARLFPLFERLAPLTLEGRPRR